MGNPSLVSDHSSTCWMIFDVFGLTILFKKYLHSHICMYYVIVYVYVPSTENGNLSIKCPKNWRDRGYWSSDIQSRVVEISRPGGWFRAENPSNFHIRTLQNNYGISTKTMGDLWIIMDFLWVFTKSREIPHHTCWRHVSWQDSCDTQQSWPHSLTMWANGTQA